MSRDRARAIGSEQGAVFVQVGISLFVLMAFNVFVLDYGMMWIGRRQAQNAADAGALAGALARGYDDFGDPPWSDVPEDSAVGVASTNLIWQQSGTSVVSFNCPSGITGRCVRVDVHRDGTNGSAQIPSLFGPILGITGQGVRATATAIVGNGNATTCLKPFALPDEWQDATHTGHYQPTDTFVRWQTPGPGTVIDPDSYTPPSSTTAVSINISSHFGDVDGRVVFDVNYAFADAVRPGFVLPLTLPGGRTHLEDMTSCNGQPIQLGQTLPINVGLMGGAGGVTETALVSAFNLDPSADYNFGDSYVINSCAPACAAVSPRLFAVPLYDPSEFQRMRAQSDWSGCPGGTPCVIVRNIVGFFIHHLSGSIGRHGHFLKYPGVTATGAPNFTDDASWLVTTNLNR
jgi:hypothetical protein